MSYCVLPFFFFSALDQRKEAFLFFFGFAQNLLEGPEATYRVVSSTFEIVQILVQSHFELVSSVLALEATELASEPSSEPVTQFSTTK